MNRENFDRLRNEVRADPNRSSAVREYVRELEAAIDSYENGITWFTTCLNCARLWDDNYNQHCKIEELEKEIKECNSHE